MHFFSYVERHRHQYQAFCQTKEYKTLHTIIQGNTEEDSTLWDSFGNLVMISQGLNSSLKNESYEIKKAHVESYYNASKSGSIESLKLLVLYWDYPNTWIKKDIEDHGKKMYGFLTEDCQQKEGNDVGSEK